jgi:hypothetical protein
LGIWVAVGILEKSSRLRIARFSLDMITPEPHLSQRGPNGKAHAGPAPEAQCAGEDLMIRAKYRTGARIPVFYRSSTAQALRWATLTGAAELVC